MKVMVLMNKNSAKKIERKRIKIERKDKMGSEDING